MRGTVAAIAGSMLLAMVSTAQADQAEVNGALRGDATIYNGLFAIAVADQIRNHCPTIEARMVRAFSFMQSLRSRAHRMGFDDDEITDFIEDRAEKDRMREFVMSYFDSNGVVEDQPETYCALGRAEIAANSQAGVLLRAR